MMRLHNSRYTQMLMVFTLMAMVALLVGFFSVKPSPVLASYCTGSYQGRGECWLYCTGAGLEIVQCFGDAYFVLINPLELDKYGTCSGWFTTPPSFGCPAYCN